MFWGATSFNRDLSAWDISRATSLVSGDNNTHVPTSKQLQHSYYNVRMVAHGVVIIFVLLFDRNDSMTCLAEPPRSMEISMLGMPHVQLAW